MFTHQILIATRALRMGRKICRELIIKRIIRFRCYACVEARPHCLVYLLDAYLAKFPANALEMDTFCLRPRLSYMSESPRYDRVPVG